MKTTFLTLEDLKIALNLFCCVYGIGTLGMPGNFSRAGPLIGTGALIFMTCANVYASVACSRVMLRAPASVRTFGDLGEMCMGKAGRFLVVSSQMAVCLLGPCVFLVLGGTLLSSMFANTFSQVTWLIIMVISVMPVCLTPTLKEGAGAAFAGCAGTIAADVIGIIVLLSGMKGHPSVPAPEFRIEQVLGAFGNLSLAFSAGVLIPALQRQHSDPSKMPRIIFITMTSISCLFLALSILAYSTVGCQISGNLLFSIFPDSATGLTALGFQADRGVAVLAYLGMQLHITIAFAVFLHPAFYTLERLIIGMHQQPSYVDIESERVQRSAATTHYAISKRIIQTDDSVLSSALVIDSVLPTTYEEELAEYRNAAVAFKYITLRIVLIGTLVAVAIVFHDHLSDFMDFIGASCISLSCIVLPILFYLKKLWAEIPLFEKTFAIVILVVCSLLGCYVTYRSGVDLFTKPDHSKPFPFCAAEFDKTLYYNSSSHRF